MNKQDEQVTDRDSGQDSDATTITSQLENKTGITDQTGSAISNNSILCLYLDHWEEALRAQALGWASSIHKKIIHKEKTKASRARLSHAHPATYSIELQLLLFFCRRYLLQ